MQRHENLDGGQRAWYVTGMMDCRAHNWNLVTANGWMDGLIDDYNGSHLFHGYYAHGIRL